MMIRKYECLICDKEFESDSDPTACPHCGGEEGTEGEGLDGGKWNSFSEALYQCPYCDVWMEYTGDRYEECQQCPQCEFYTDAEHESIEEHLATVSKRLGFYRQRVCADILRAHKDVEP